MADEVVIKDFTVSDTNIEFKNRGKTFEAYPDLPLDIMQNLGKFKRMTKTLEEEGMEPVLELFDALLLPQSASLFRAEVKNKNIGIKTLMGIIPWLLEQYGLRPTQPSSPSSTGLDDGETGTSFEDGALVSESIH